MNSYNSIIIFGPTASGKTRLAAHLALAANGAVLSFDSRQVYTQLNIGAGKDLDEFKIDNKLVPHYLTDICDLNTNFHSYAFVKSYITAFEDCIEKKLLPVLCGGTGLYFDLVLKKYQYINIPVDENLRKELYTFDEEALLKKLNSFPKELIKQADTSTHKRIIRAIEIAVFLSESVHQKIAYPDLKPIIFGIKLTTSERNNNISARLEHRLKNGLIEEVRQLLSDGVPAERLIYLGLEYKYVTEYLSGKYNYDTMVQLLQTAIIQYAKRQMTWFRKMEREGNIIHWIDGMLPLQEQQDIALKLMN